VRSLRGVDVILRLNEGIEFKEGRELSELGMDSNLLIKTF